MFHPTREELTQLPPLCRMREVTLYLAVHERTVRGMIAEGKLPAYRIGHEYRFKREDVEALLRPVPTTGA